MSNRIKMLTVIPDRIESKIFLIRGKKIMLDRDLAELYEVGTRMLNQAVRRNIERFPADFMFQLNVNEMTIWKSQIVISNSEKMGLRKRPLAFTEQGVAMLSSVLNSNRAIQVNIQIIRTFTKLREIIASNRELRIKIEKIENKYDQQFKIVFEAIRKLLEAPAITPRKIGFNTLSKRSEQSRF